MGDRRNGFGVPAKSLIIMNHGGGYKEDHIYFKTSENGKAWSTTHRLSEGEQISYSPDDGLRIFKILVWSASRGLECSIIATPGLWTFSELYEAKILKQTSVDEGS